jgi:hypothetical protein
MIPKVIHYCWFGRGKMPQLALDCISSWRKYLPDYDIKVWNEENFDVNSVPYTEQAYRSRKFAFVTDYVRLYAIYNFGGIYMDTDVEVLKNLDAFLKHPAFSGFETECQVPTGIMGGESKNEWFRIQLNKYENKNFILPNGRYDMTTNVETISLSMKDESFLFNNTTQDFKGIITMYSKDYFCPKSYLTGKIEITENTHCIHHFAGSWLSKSQKRKKYIIQLCGANFIPIYKRIKSFIIRKRK